MRILVTGATSNLGAEIAVSLCTRGHQIRGVALPGLPQDHLDQRQIPLLTADITDEDAMLRATEGMDAVVHCAGMVSFDAHARARIFRVNVDGSRIVAGSAKRSGAQRLIHISSIAAFGLPQGRAKIDERSPTEATGLPYNDSKREAEAAVRDAAAGMALTILRPACIYGRYDRSFVPVMIKTIGGGYFSYLGDPEKPMSMSSSAFLADAIARLLEAAPAASPETFVAVEGPSPSTRQVMETIAAALGKKPPRGSLSPGMLKLVGRMFDVTGRLGLKLPVSLPSALVANSLVDADFDGSALRRRVGMEDVDSLARLRLVIDEVRARR